MYGAMLTKRPAMTSSYINRITIWKEDGVEDDYYVDEVYIGGNMLVDPADGPGEFI
jgi:hypothetical protein